MYPPSIVASRIHRPTVALDLAAETVEEAVAEVACAVFSRNFLLTLTALNFLGCVEDWLEPNGTKEGRAGVVEGGCEAEVAELDAETDGGDAVVVAVSLGVSDVDAPWATCSVPSSLPLRLALVDSSGLAVSVFAINAS